MLLSVVAAHALRLEQTQLRLGRHCAEQLQQQRCMLVMWSPLLMGAADRSSATEARSTTEARSG